jgi:hypothetical protein
MPRIPEDFTKPDAMKRAVKAKSDVAQQDAKTGVPGTGTYRGRGKKGSNIKRETRKTKNWRGK